MAILITGFVIFFATHLTPGVFGLRQTLVSRLGEGRFRAIYIASSVVGMSCILIGKSMANYVGVYVPPLWAVPVVPVLIALGFILLAALFMPTNIRRLTPHPMLWGITLWSAGHLLANGDLASVIMFSGFGAYSLVSIRSLNTRGAKPSSEHYTVLQDLRAVTAGLTLYGLTIWAHPYVIGVPAIL